uniref:tryptophan 7-halogenase n=1 Tax=Ningiella ruwaisensis TaxID=2364274 RepID=UPI00109FA25E|nr:tryptophan 7-halogenase [Ningiella ruwaisensis]
MKKVVILGQSSEAVLYAIAIKVRLSCEVILIKDINQPEPHRYIETLLPDTLRILNQLGLKEQQWLPEVDGVYCTAIEVTTADAYNVMLPFSPIGTNINGLDFHSVAFNTLNKINGKEFEAFSLGAQMSRKGKFVHPVNDDNSVLSSFDYGVNVDNIKFAHFLNAYAKYLNIEIIHADTLSFDWAFCENASENQVKTLRCNTSSKDVLEVHNIDFLIDSAESSYTLRADAQLDNIFENDISPSIQRQVSMSVEVNSPRLFSPQCLSLEVGQLFIRASSKTLCLQLFLQDGVSLIDGETALRKFASSYPYLPLINDEIAKGKVNTVISSKQPLKSLPWQANVIKASNLYELCPVLQGSIALHLENVMSFIDLAPNTSAHSSLRNEYNRQFVVRHNEYNSFAELVIHLMSKKQAAKLKSEKASRVLKLYQNTGRYMSEANQVVDNTYWLNILLVLAGSPNNYNKMLAIPSETRDILERIKNIISVTCEQLPETNVYMKHLLNQ